MHPAAPSSLLLAYSLALMPGSEVTMSDLEEKDVDEFNSSGLKCPTCFTIRGRQCNPEIKWCAKDRIKCLEFSGVINTGVSLVTSYMRFPVTNQSLSCKSAIRRGATDRAPTPIFFVLFLKKLLH
uniref:LY6/PLAUR domain containing 9 n=1 Tax=Nannospalax galili TaxID=1026970 RepID=A0A8C6W333_NANGA